jgi:DNA-binding transcriptional ArsR family regulator
MPVTRRAVLEALAATSDAATRQRTTVEALASALDSDKQTIEARLSGLRECELARISARGRARVTITGEELLELEADEMIVVDPE